jgi:inorganic pyrophosphatase
MALRKRTHTIKQLCELEKETKVVLVVRLVHAQTEYVDNYGKVMNWTLMDGTGFVMCNIWDDNHRVEKAEKSCKYPAKQNNGFRRVIFLGESPSCN